MSDAHLQESATRHLIAYPFPFEEVLGSLQLPTDGLTREEAERLKVFIESLVTHDD